MLKFLRLTTAPCLVLLAQMSGCSTEQRQAISPSPTPSSSLSTKPILTPVTSTAPSPSPQTDPFPDANDKAIGAATISQSAQSKDDWNLVFGMWQEAITLMKAVPKSSSNYALAQKKVTEYQRSLAFAKQQAVKPLAPPDFTIVEQPSNLMAPANASTPKVKEENLRNLTVHPANASTPKTAAKPAKSAYEKFTEKELSAKASVNKFMEDYFETTVNKGLSGTSSWCAASYDLASSLYSPESWKILDVSVYPDAGIASVRTRIESSTKGGSPIRQNWTFSLNKGDTYLEKMTLKEGSTDSYKYSKSKYGGWCIHLINER